MIQTPSSILIVGGGTAGWITASILQHAWGAQGVQITLIESPSIPTIGVGEGSTPALRKFFSYLKIAEKDWMPKVNATYKVGISFKDWSTKTGFSEYFHPFFGVADIEQSSDFFKAADMMRAGKSTSIHTHKYFLAPLLAELRKSPSPTTNEKINHIDYGYHFDAGLLAEFLKNRLLAKGLTLLKDNVTKIELSDPNRISCLQLEKHDTISADLYIDCTGFASLLHQKTLGAEFHSYSTQLFNDAAVTIATPHTAPLTPVTTSTALSAGWAWQIPLTSRIGNGYVYSSTYLSQEQAEAELRQFLKLGTDIPARHLKMKAGRVKEHWKGNCLAVGLSQGFIEPLEATALALVQSTVENFVDAFERPSANSKQEFNSYMNAMFDGVRDYILTHYLTNSRNDSNYWRDSRSISEVPNSLNELLSEWKSDHNFFDILFKQNRQAIYKPESWYALLAGVGYFGAEPALDICTFALENHPSYAVAQKYFNDLDERIAELKENQHAITD